jgi:hypothetical protein
MVAQQQLFIPMMTGMAIYFLAAFGALLRRGAF